MGAEYLSLEIKAKSYDKMIKKFEKICQAELAEYGHQQGYSGSWGCFVGHKPKQYMAYDLVKRWTKKKKHEAIDYLLENVCEKWETPRYIKTTNGFLIAAIAPS